MKNTRRENKADHDANLDAYDVEWDSREIEAADAAADARAYAGTTVAERNALELGY